MDSPGITVRPIETMHGVEEFCEVFFDGVIVPADRLLGEVDRGWSIAMDLLPFERSTALWQRAAYLQRRLQQLVHRAPPGSLDPADVGAVTELLWAFRARSRATQYRLAAGEHLGAETSVDKVLVATAEQAVFELAGDALGNEIALGDDPASGLWRAEFLYARAASIYGGSAEIQRNIIARRLLELGDDAVMERAERALFTRGIRDATDVGERCAARCRAGRAGLARRASTPTRRPRCRCSSSAQGAANVTSVRAGPGAHPRAWVSTDDPARERVVLPALRTVRGPGVTAPDARRAVRRRGPRQHWPRRARPSSS